MEKKLMVDRYLGLNYKNWYSPSDPEFVYELARMRCNKFCGIFSIYTAKPNIWSPTFVDDDGKPGIVSTFWVKQSYIADGMQYELYNHLVFDNRDSLYIVTTAMKYCSEPLRQGGMGWYQDIGKQLIWQRANEYGV